MSSPIDQAQFNFSPTIGLAVSVMVGFLLAAIWMRVPVTGGSSSATA